MYLLFIEKWFDNAIAKAIGWTLVHSLWQGFILGIIALLMILLTRRSRSSTRYSLFTGLFFLFIGVSVITFIVQWQSFVAVPDVKLSAATIAQLQNLTVIPVEQVKTNDSSLVGQFTWYFNSWCPWIIAAWFIVFVVKCVRFGISYSHVQRIRRDQSFLVPALVQKVNELATRLRIRQTVLVRESIIVNVPMTIGFLKPLILVPVGLINNLSAEQVEAILLHELAHIRRKDYLVNLVQCLAETIFFFNPAILWLSSLIREERENCCDDMAISVTKSRSTFVHALMAFQEYRTGNTLAPAFPGNKYPLLKRIQRIVYNNNKNLNNMEKIFLALGLAVVCFVGLAFSNATSNTHKKNHPVIGNMRVSIKQHNSFNYADSIPAGDKLTGTITTTVDDVEYKVKLKDDKVIELTVAGQRIDEGKISDYKSSTDKIIAEARERFTYSLMEKDLALKFKELTDQEKLFTQQQNKLLQNKIKENELVNSNKEKINLDLMNKITTDVKVQSEMFNKIKIANDQNLLFDNKINVHNDKDLINKLFQNNNENIFKQLESDKFIGDILKKDRDFQIDKKEFSIQSDHSFSIESQTDTSKPRKVDVRESKKRKVKDGDEKEFKFEEKIESKKDKQDKPDKSDDFNDDSKKEFDLKMKEMRNYQAQLKKEMDMTNKRIDNMKKEHENRMNRIRKDELRRKDQEGKERANEKRAQQAEKRKEEFNERRKEMEDRRDEMRERREAVIEELKDDKIIPEDAKDVSINMNDNEMTVNGVKQPEKVFQKYKSKYYSAPKKQSPPKAPKPAVKI